MIKKILLILMTVILSGCSPIVLNIEELMQPPSLSKEQADILNALQLSLNVDKINLKYPEKGDYRSAFVLENLDSDEEKEALVFYEQTDKQTVATRINVLDKKDGVWNSVYDTPGLNSNIEFIEFSNLVSKDNLTLLIGWNDSANLSKSSKNISTLSAYSYNNQKLDKLFDYSYILYDVIKGRTFNELDKVIFITDSLSNPSVKLIEKRNSTQAGIVATVKLNTNIESYYNFSYGKINGTENAIFIDEQFEGKVYSEIITLNNLVLSNLMLDDNLESNEYLAETQRYEELLCTDIDNDGIIEIPSQKILLGYGNEKEIDNKYLTTFKVFSPDGFTEKENAFVNLKDGYKIIFPEKWINKVTIKTQPNSGEQSFVLFNETLSDSTNELLKIRIYSNADYKDKFILEQYKMIASKGMFEYYAYIPPKKDAENGITYEELEEMFKLI